MARRTITTDRLPSKARDSRHIRLVLATIDPFKNCQNLPHGHLSIRHPLEVVLEAQSLSEEELGAFLRRRGLHEAQLQAWREAVLAGLKETPRRSSKRSDEAKRIRALEGEPARKEKALAEAAALLVLQKKARALWGEEDDDTPRKKGRKS